jgi:Tfp pilus assembly protein PilN
MRTWLAFGTGVGIEVCGRDLRVTVARARPAGVQILGELDIPGFHEQAAATWGDQYAQFLRQLGVAHVAATVLLPRDAVIARQLQLPGVSDRNLASALKFQVDSLHPWPEDEAVWDYARAGKTDTILLGITRRGTMDEYLTLFAEAGVKIARFTFSAAAIQPALRFYSVPPAGFLAWSQNGELELYGESPSRPVFSASFDQQPELAVASALSELRLDPSDQPVPIESLLPTPAAAPEGTELSHSARSYAAALTSACPWLALRLNLLPEDQRQASSRALYFPTIALASLILITTVALLAYGSWEQRRYLETLQLQIRQITPKANRASRLEQQISETRARADAIDRFRLRSKEDMDALNETTRVLAPPSFLTSMSMARQSVEMSGHADQAAGFLKLLDGTGKFQNSTFTMPIQRDATGENFSLRAQRKGVTTQ